MVKRRNVVAVVGLAAAMVLSLASCASQSSTLSPADNFVIDCTAVSTTIGEYGTNLQALITAVTADDPEAASAAAEAFSASAKDVVDQLPGLPPEAQGFLQTSQDFAEQVKEVVSSKGDLAPLADEAKATFATKDFTTGADAVEALYRQECPTEAATQGG